MYDWLIGLAGIAMLFAGGELAVRGSVSLARRLSLSPLLIGIVIVGFMTSMPELVVSVRAIVAGRVGVAMGNVVGSDIVNILLVLGVAALISPIVAGRVCARRDALVMTAAVLAVLAFALLGPIGWWQGLLMVAALVTYVVWSYRVDSGAPTPEAALHAADAADAEGLPPLRRIWEIVALLIAGFGMLILGATWVVDSATVAARALGLSEAAIGLTIVALGTSLPELAAGVASARHGHSELVIGNVIGSNIFNMLGILGLCALARPVPVDGLIAALDLPVLFLLALALMPVFFGRAGLKRWTAALMVVAYLAYFALRFLL